MKLRKIANNQTELRLNGITVLISYETPVAYINEETLEYFKTSKKWSATTSKHINAWLCGEEAAEVDQEVLDNLLKAA